jgi:hypothetical protein
MGKNIMEEETKTPSAEELQEEEKALAETKEDEIRSSIIEKYGLDEDEQTDLVDKLTKDFVAQQKSFGKVVHQKRTWREKALTAKPEKKEDKGTPDDVLKKATELVEERFTQRDLDDLELSDELKEEVKKLAKLKSISIRKAFSDPYISYLKSQEEAEQKLDKATITRKNKGATVAIDTSKPLNPADFDLTTEEGRKEWDEAKKARKQ